MASDNKKIRRKKTEGDTAKSSTSIPIIPTIDTKKEVKKTQQPLLFAKTAEKKDVALDFKALNLTKSQNFDPSMPIYLQINANNIYKYFATALISPLYEENSNFADVQSLNQTVITLSNGFIGTVQERTVLIELILHIAEVKLLDIKDGIAFFEKSLPISRIKNILVAHTGIASEIVNTSNVGDGGIIPEKLFSYFLPNHLIYTLPNIQFNEKPIPKANGLFDKILGAFAFLKNYNILTANKTNSAKTLPDHFLTAAKTLNKNYDWESNNDKASAFYKILFRMNVDEQPLLQWLVKRMIEGDNFTDNDVFTFADLIAKSRQDFFNDARDVFNSLMKSLERKNAIREIPQLKHSEKFYLYLFAVLRLYGNNNTEDKSISRADLPELVFPGYGEYTFSCLGYFYGYTNLRNYEDRLKLNDPVFHQLFIGDKRLPLKFSIDTALELSLIESVYEYVFNGYSDIKIPDYRVFPQINVELVRRPQNIEGKYNFEAIVAHGKAIYTLAKKSNIDRLDKLLQGIQTIPAISVLGAQCYRNKLILHSVPLFDIGKVEHKNVFYYKKEDILQAVRTGILKADEVIENAMFGLNSKEF